MYNTCSIVYATVAKYIQQYKTALALIRVIKEHRLLLTSALIILNQWITTSTMALLTVASMVHVVLLEHNTTVWGTLYIGGLGHTPSQECGYS